MIKRITLTLSILFLLSLIVILNSSKSVYSGYKIFSLKIPSKMYFAGELVPQKDPEVKERIDRELLVNTYWQSNTILSIKRSSRYFPIIEPILKKNNIPEDFKYLALIESNFITTATSPSGAKGVWQIMKNTGREYGLEINKNVDERLDVVKATELACKYLKKSKKRLGSWTLAAAAYNAGQNGISRRLIKQKTKSYYGLVLSQEPSRYVFRILAMKEILENPSKYGFNIKKNHLYKRISTSNIMIDYPIKDISEWATKLGYTYKSVKFLNPWLLENRLNNKSKKEYTILLPKDKNLFK